MIIGYNLTVEQGTSFSEEFTLSNESGAIDLTSAIIRSQFRLAYNSATAYDFIAIKSDPTNGVILLTLTPTYSASIVSGNYIWDAEYQVGSSVVRFIKGVVTVNPRVTQI